MEVIKFREIEEKHLLGEWTVKNKILSRSNPLDIFATAHTHFFSANGLYTIKNGAEFSGRWSINLKDEIVRSPLLRFSLHPHGTTNAIITRLLSTHDQKRGEITLYLSTGLELTLQRK